MGLPEGIGIVDTMIGFPAEDFKMYDFIRAQLKDPSTKFEFPVEYMFKNVPKELYGAGDPISITLQEMDRHGVEIGLIGVGGDVSRKGAQGPSRPFCRPGLGRSQSRHGRHPRHGPAV
jgi:hypothetical protein